MKFRLITYCLFITFISCLLFSCSKDDSGDNESTDVNHWIASKMRDRYLWADKIPADSKLSFSSDAEVFFNSLLSTNDGKTRDGSHYFYSYIEKNKDYHSTATKTTIDPDDTYGLEFVIYAIVDKQGVSLGYDYARVIYVLPGSPAAQAGLKRGLWITSIDGALITTSNYKNLISGDARTLKVMQDYGGTTTEVNMSKSVAVADDPVFAHNVITVGSHKIAYLLYTRFASGTSNDDSEHSYDNELIKVFDDFIAQGCSDLVLDLRYNGGGFLSCAQLLARMIVPDQYKSETFCILTDNKGKTTTMAFNGSTLSKNASSLGVSKVYILTSSLTASASEAVINGLKPFINVVLIGNITEGKNVGSVHYAEDKYEWAIQPIVTRITSKNTSLDYSSGFNPDYKKNEFLMSENKTLYDFGNSNEYYLSFVISLITGNAASSVGLKSVLLPSVSALPVYNSFSRHATNGVLLGSRWPWE